MVAYQRETLTDAFIAEVEPLLREHFASMKFYEGYEYEADWASYRFLEGLDQLFVFTAREEGVLIGYAAFAVHQNMHCKAMRHAIQDLVFITPEGRKGFAGYSLLKFADVFLEEAGVNRVTHYTPVEDGFGPLLTRMGYEMTEHAFTKRLQ